MIDRRMVFLGMLAFVALSLSGCATPQRGITRLEVLQLLVEIDQRNQNGIKPAEQYDLLRAELSLEKMRAGFNLSGYEKCQQDFKDLQMENAALRAANQHLLELDNGRK